MNAAQKANKGDDYLMTDTPVDFAKGETIVITGHVKTFNGICSEFIVLFSLAPHQEGC